MPWQRVIRKLEPKIARGSFKRYGSKLLFEYEDLLRPYFNMYGAPNFDSFRYGVTHKGKFFTFLNEYLPDLCPETTLIRKDYCLASIDELRKYPYVVKPAAKDFTQSFYRLNDGKKAITVSNGDQAKATLNHLLKTQKELILQEKFPLSQLMMKCLFIVILIEAANYG